MLKRMNVVLNLGKTLLEMLLMIDLQINLNNLKYLLNKHFH